MSLHKSGFEIVEGIFQPAQIKKLKELFETHAGGKHGMRNILDLPEVADLAQRFSHLASGGRPVRGIFFDKLPDSNWKVPWHQDVTIAIAERHDLPGYGPWSTKEGIVHVQPPSQILEQMVAVRLHLDDCPKENGALRVIPASHLQGKLASSAIDALVQSRSEVICECAAGDVLLMKPLTLHASSPSEDPGHRRVIHLEFCSTDLPAPLTWRF